MKEERKVAVLATGIILGLAAIVAVVYFVFYKKPPVKESPVETAVVEKAAPAGEEASREILAPLPFPNVKLDESDPALREAAALLSNHSLYSIWLKTGNLARKFVAAVDNVANGYSPYSHINFFSPEGKFLVRREPNGVFIDPRSYARYDPAARVFASLDPVLTVRLYRAVKPVLQEAYAELGYPGSDFEKTLVAAIKELLRTPVVPGKIRVNLKITTYEMVDPYLENLNQAQKHFLRMGPDNVTAVQAKLRELATLLGVSPTDLPPEKMYQAK